MLVHPRTTAWARDSGATARRPSARSPARTVRIPIGATSTGRVPHSPSRPTQHFGSVWHRPALVPARVRETELPWTVPECPGPTRLPVSPRPSATPSFNRLLRVHNPYRRLSELPGTHRGKPGHASPVEPPLGAFLHPRRPLRPGVSMRAEDTTTGAVLGPCTADEFPDSTRTRGSQHSGWRRDVRPAP